MSILAIFTPVTETRKEVVETAKAANKDGKKSEDEYLENLVQVLYIRYLIIFQKKSVPILAFFISGSEVNAIYLIFAQELKLLIKPMDVGVQKIDDITLNTVGIIVTAFLMIDKVN